MPQTLCEAEKRYLEKQMQHGKAKHLESFSGNKKNILKTCLQKKVCNFAAKGMKNKTLTKHESYLVQ